MCDGLGQKIIFMKRRDDILYTFLQLCQRVDMIEYDIWSINCRAIERHL